MTIDVQGPDGTTISFPDGTDAETVNSVMQKHFGGAAPTAPSDKTPGFGLDDAVRMTAEGVPILGGLATKGEAALSATFPSSWTPGGSTAPDWSTRYSENLEKEKAKSEAIRKAHPWLSGAAHVVGAIAGTAPMVMAAPEAFGISADPLLARTLAAGTTGGVIGGADAAARDEPVLKGAAVGGLTSAVAPGAGDLIGSAIGKVLPSLQQIPGILKGVNPMALQWGREMLKADGMDAAAIAAKEAELGPRGFVAEYGPNGVALARAVRAQPGTAKADITEAFRGRTSGARDAVTADIDQVFGPKINIPEYVKFLEETRKANADPLYQQFKSMEIPPTEDLINLIPKLKDLGALDEAKKLMPGRNFSVNYGWPANNFPTAEQWNYAKRGLDSIMEKTKPGSVSANPSLFRVAAQTKRELLEALENHPDPTIAQVYQEARQNWAEPSSMMTSLEEGRNWRQYDPDELKILMENKSALEQRAFTQGARADLHSALTETARGGTKTRDLLLAPANQDRIASLPGPNGQPIGKDGAQKLTEAMERHKREADTSHYVLGNSATAESQAMEKLVTPNPENTLTHRIATAYLPHIMPGVLLPKSLQTMAASRQAAKYETARNELAPLLMKQGSDAADIVRALLAYRGTAAQQISPTVTSLLQAIVGPSYRSQER